jgi:hypothetical protein
MSDGRLQAKVELAGDAPPGLELYFLADGKTLAYRQLTDAGCQTVQLISEEPAPAEISRARLELVQAGVVWYEMDCVII